MCDLKKQKNSGKPAFNETNTLCCEKMWKHKDTVDIAGELINN